MYVDFLEEHLSEIMTFSARHQKFFFKRMASHLGNIRNNEQCRSHHQKMMKTFKGVHQIIEHFRNLYPKEQTTEEGAVQSERKDISMTNLSSDEKVFSYCCQEQESWLEVEQFLNLDESLNLQNCGIFLDEITP